jgi:hypothetical protein
LKRYSTERQLYVPMPVGQMKEDFRDDSSVVRWNSSRFGASEKSWKVIRNIFKGFLWWDKGGHDIEVRKAIVETSEWWGTTQRESSGPLASF